MQPWNLLLRVLFFVLVAHAAFAQTASSELATPFLYKNDKEWHRSYEGRINGVHDVLLNLHFDGEDCWGTLHYMKSKVVLNVEGKIEGSRLLLKELDLYGNQTGKIAGEITPDSITADWSNADNSIGSRLVLSSASASPDNNNFWSGQWVRSFKGDHRGRTVHLILQNAHTKPLHAHFYFPEERKTYTGEARHHENSGVFQIPLVDENGQDAGMLKINLNSPENLSCVFRNTQGYNKIFELSKSFSLYPGLFEYASYASSYNASFPLINGQYHFNEMIMEVVNGWSENAQKHYSRIVWDLSFPKPEQRNAYRGYIWFHIDFLSEELISGRLTYSNTWDRDYQVFSFNYHFKDQKPLDLYDLLEKDSNYKTFLQNKIVKELETRPFNEDQLYFNWVKRQDFNHFNIRNEGLVFRTNYSPIYGTQEVTIPFFQLRQFFKIDNPIKFLIR